MGAFQIFKLVGLFLQACQIVDDAIHELLSEVGQFLLSNTADLKQLLGPGCLTG